MYSFLMPFLYSKKTAKKTVVFLAHFNYMTLYSKNQQLLAHNFKFIFHKSINEAYMFQLTTS